MGRLDQTEKTESEPEKVEKQTTSAPVEKEKRIAVVTISVVLAVALFVGFAVLLAMVGIWIANWGITTMAVDKEVVQAGVYIAVAIIIAAASPEMMRLWLRFLRGFLPKIFY